MSSFLLEGFGGLKDEHHSTEIENLLQNTEFESKQLFRAIENEKVQIANIKKELELRPKQIKEVEMSTRRCEEEVKRLHRQLTHNVSMCETVKKNTTHLDEQIETMRNKLENLVNTTAEREEEYKQKLEKYQTIWKSYHQKYCSNPKAQELETIQQNVEELVTKKSELVKTREMLERKFNSITGNGPKIEAVKKPRWTDWFVKVASIKVDTMRLQNEASKIYQTKMNVTEERNFLEQRLASLNAQALEKSPVQIDEGMNDALQEQCEGQASIELASDVVEMVSERTTLFVNPQDEQETSNEPPPSIDQQTPQFTFTDTSENCESSQFGIAAASGTSQGEGGFNFAGFGSDTNNQTGLQLISEPKTTSFSSAFSFTSPGGGGNSVTAGMSLFDSPSSVTSGGGGGGGQENFSFLFSGPQTPAKTSTNVFNF